MIFHSLIFFLFSISPLARPTFTNGYALQQGRGGRGDRDATDIIQVLYLTLHSIRERSGEILCAKRDRITSDLVARRYPQYLRKLEEISKEEERGEGEKDGEGHEERRASDKASSEKKGRSHSNNFK